MISNDLRGLVASMKAHVDAEMMCRGFFEVFAQRLHAVADDIEELERSAVPPRLCGRRSSAQLELIEGGKP